ncbi:heme lyase CcmF/NrfE family subunit [Metallumcola ferriviriculae]|uniref:Heme lyase CcmF/NrfE family subunit n=1 Tax=Metallumcola ferriviriculae TaxID=3039180 RepID=A0AAU0UK79_9FIRM|nr:heme lyase CcmF/NrfE family subunit [Desulfitibacteraceae bacterium MK1]
MADIGYLALVIAVAIGVYSLAAFIISIVTDNEKLKASAKGGVAAIGLLTTAASFILIYLLLVGDFSVKYVFEYTSTNLPLFYKLSAFWAGNAGSLLLWSWVLAIYTTIVTFSKKHEQDEKIPYVSAILLVINIFFLLVMTLNSSPFERIPSGVAVPMDGQGLNPMLQNPGMVFHPVTLYLGYVGFAVPYAFAMAALLTKKVDDSWIKVTRRWTIIAWMFLSLGNLYGAQWAYVELGWGGFWAWDPVENASFIPWLTGTAFLHSVMIQERKDMLKIWNMSLIIITFILTLFGTFLVRSGVLQSVHAFSNSGLGTWFLAFMCLAAVVSLYLLVDRINLLKQGNKFESYISKESSFLVNNLLLVGAAFATFWGTIFPLISEAVRGVRVTVSVPFFNQVNGPILLATIFVMGVCPLIAWQRASLKNIANSFLWPLILSVLIGVGLYLYLPGHELYGALAFLVATFVMLTILQEFYRGVRVRRRMTEEGFLTAFGRLMTRNRRRYGGYTIHLGIILISLAIIGSGAYKQEVTKQVSVGETITIDDYAITFNGLRQRQEGENDVVYAEMPVMKDGQVIGTITPEKVFYATWEQPSTEVAIKGTLVEDLYVILATWENSGQTATFKVHVNPLMSWMWIGGYILVLGTIFAVWPGKGSQLGPKYTQ